MDKKSVFPIKADFKQFKTYEPMNVVKFTIEESKVNKGTHFLIAHEEIGQKWVCSGDHWNPGVLVKYEQAFDFKISELKQGE